MKRYFTGLKKLIQGDSLTRFELLKVVSKLILPSYRFKWPQMDWWENEEFNYYLNKFGELNGMNTDRRWMLSQLLRLTIDIPGDTAECGAYLGASSYSICHFNQINLPGQRQHLIFDSFEGLSEPDSNDNEFWQKGDLAATEEQVKKTLEEFSDTLYFKGWIPNRFKECEGRKFSFVHIDVDLYEPTLESMKFFYPRLAAGGIIVCDDYGFTTCTGATKAIEEFLHDKPEKMISLCSGGGFMIKGVATQN